MVGEIISSTERTRYDGPVSMTIYGIDVIPLISMLIDKIAQEYNTLNVVANAEISPLLENCKT